MARSMIKTKSAENTPHLSERASGHKIVIPKGETLDQPIEVILYPKDGQRVMIVAEPGSTGQVVILGSTALDKNSCAQSLVVEVFVKKQSSIQIVQVQTSNSDKRTQSRTKVYLDGEESKAMVQQLVLGRDQQHLNMNTKVIHRARKTTSNISIRNILWDQAEAVSRGLARIESSAHGSDADLRIDTLLVGKGAEVSPVPNLEVENHDVQCSHGSTTSSFDPNQLFYLMSRGLSAEQAKAEIIMGFIHSFSDSFKGKKFNSFHQKAQKMIHSYIQRS